MNITESIRLSFESLKSNKLRSFLTMLGIIIGISAVITITTIGNSLQKTIASTMRELGGTNLTYAYVNAITPEFETDAEWEAWQYPEMTKDEQLTYERLSEFQTDFADRVEAVVVEEMLISAASSTGDKSSAKVSVNGVTPGYLSSSKLPMIIINPIPGQEEENAEFLEQSGVAVWLRKNDSPDIVISNLLNSENLLESMKEKTHNLAHIDSTKNICEILKNELI